MRWPPVAGFASLVLACSLAVAVRGLAAAPTATPKQPGPLGVSPLLVDAAAEAWTVIARESNPIWPGWNAGTTPLLLYLPGKQDLLIGHPRPPEDFRPYAGPLAFPGASMWVKDGPTIVGGDGQNTSTDVAGVRTLVMSLAPVDDEASSMWMRALYEARFKRGEETALAVRSASRRVLEWLRRLGRAPEPRLWGAFVAVGE